MARTQVCKLPQALADYVDDFAQQRGISKVAAIELIFERGQAAIEELERRGYRATSAQMPQPQRVGISTQAKAYPTFPARPVPVASPAHGRVGISIKGQ
jgi:hypothetical protein